MKTFFSIISLLIACLPSLAQQGTSMRATNGIGFGVSTFNGPIAATNATTTNQFAGKFRQGFGTTASGNSAAAFGRSTLAAGTDSLASGAYNTISSSGNASTSSGTSNTISGGSSHVEGIFNEAGGTASHSQGIQTVANGTGSHASGLQVQLQSGTDYTFGGGLNIIALGTISNSFLWNADWGNTMSPPTGSVFMVDAPNGIFFDGNVYVSNGSLVGDGSGITNLPPSAGVGAISYTVSGGGQAIVNGVYTNGTSTSWLHGGGPTATSLEYHPGESPTWIFYNGATPLYSSESLIGPWTIEVGGLAPAPTVLVGGGNFGVFYGDGANLTNIGANSIKSMWASNVFAGGTLAVGSIVSSGTITGNGAGLTNVTVNTTNLVATLAGMSALYTNGTIYIRTDAGANDLLQTFVPYQTSSAWQNSVANFGSAIRLATTDPEGTLTGTTLASMADDASPDYVNTSYIGANHGLNVGLAVTKAAHGKDDTDVGSLWNDTTNTFVLARVVSSSVLWFIGTNAGTFWASYPTAAGATLTNIPSTGATHTGSISGSTSAQVDIVPAVKPVSLTMLADGAALSTNTLVYPSRLTIREVYDVIDPAQLVTYLQANVGSNPAVSFTNAGTLARMINNYEYQPSGACLVEHSVQPSQTLYIPQRGLKGIQSAMWTAPASGSNIFCTPTNVILMPPAADSYPNFNLRAWVQLTTNSSGIYSGLGLGYISTVDGDTSSSRLADTGKIYPSAKSSGYLSNGVAYGMTAFRAPMISQGSNAFSWFLVNGVTNVLTVQTGTVTQVYARQPNEYVTTVPFSWATNSAVSGQTNLTLFGPAYSVAWLQYLPGQTARLTGNTVPFQNVNVAQSITSAIATNNLAYGGTNFFAKGRFGGASETANVIEATGSGAISSAWDAGGRLSGNYLRLSAAVWAEVPATGTLQIGGNARSLTNLVWYSSGGGATASAGTNVMLRHTPGAIPNLLVTSATNGPASLTATAGFIVKSNAWLNVPTLAEGDNWYTSSNGVPHVVWLYGGTLTTNRLVP